MLASTTATPPQPIECTSADGTRLRGRIWEGTDPRGTLVVSHGLGEYGGCYDETARRIAGTPGLVDIVAFDFRGHGLSPGKRAVVKDYSELVADLRAAIAWAAGRRPGRPTYVLGHSNGGQVALRLVLDHPSDVAGLILSNPLLKLAAIAPAWKVAIGKILRRIAPSVTLDAELDQARMTRERSAWPERDADPLRHSCISAPLYFGMIEGGPQIIARAGEIVVPTLLLLSGSDEVVDPNTTWTFFEKLGSTDKAVRFYPEMVHEPLNDIGRETVQADVIDWLAARLPDS